LSATATALLSTSLSPLHSANDTMPNSSKATIEMVVMTLVVIFTNVPAHINES
jgi:hypothetical protein